MQIGVPKETAEGECRVALVPEIIKKMAQSRGGDDAEPVEIVVEHDAGANALIPDSQYEEAGAKLEGVMRDRLVLAGKSRDALLYSLTRRELTACLNANMD